MIELSLDLVLKKKKKNKTCQSPSPSSSIVSRVIHIFFLYSVAPIFGPAFMFFFFFFFFQRKEKLSPRMYVIYKVRVASYC